MSNQESNNKAALEAALSRMTKETDHGFLGRVLQNMTIKLADWCPTAGVMFNPKTKNFEMIVSPTFMQKLTTPELQAVLIHEIMHVTHKHVFFDMERLKYEKMQLNVAQDLVINQLIKNLPDNCMSLDKFRDKDKKPFPKNQVTEKYYDMLGEAEIKVPNQGKGDGKGEGQGESEGQGSEQGKQQGNGQGEWMKVKDWLDGRKVVFDDHSWNEASEGQEADNKEQLEALRDLIKRTMQKSSTDHAKAPQHVQDLLKEIEAELAKLDYKRLLMSALKKSLPSSNRERTWKRPNKRYGEFARGSTYAKMPKLEVLIDTSGSISIEEVNEFLKITNNFMTVGVEKAELTLFHTAAYHTETIKKNFQLDPKVFQSGGTDVTEALQKALKKAPDMIIMITDGYFSFPEIAKNKLPNNMVFVISKGGTTSHPLKAHGTSVQYK